MLLLRYLQLRAKFGWSLSNLAALLRQQLFVHREVWQPSELSCQEKSGGMVEFVAQVIQFGFTAAGSCRSNGEPRRASACK